MTNADKPAVHQSQPGNPIHPLFYPSRQTFNDEQLAISALEIAQQLQDAIKYL